MHTADASYTQIWLQYYNRVLFEQGVITEKARNRLAQAIAGKSG